MTQRFDHEETPEGAQALIPGVPPINPRERLEQRQNEPLRGGNARCDVGLFDDSPKQPDMLDLI